MLLKLNKRKDTVVFLQYRYRAYTGILCDCLFSQVHDIGLRMGSAFRDRVHGIGLFFER
jgi:hypothetical protein